MSAEQASSDYESAMCKLENGSPPLQFDSLPSDRGAYLWDHIKEKYGLELLELSALKNARCPVAGNVPSIVSILSNVDSPLTSGTVEAPQRGMQWTTWLFGTGQSAYQVGSGHIWHPDNKTIPARSDEEDLYSSIGELLKDEPSVVKVKDLLTSLCASEVLPLPFVLVTAPSGSGKTQLPFALRAAGLQVIHLSIATNYSADPQPVYKPMQFHSTNLREAVWEDFRRNRAITSADIVLRINDVKVNETPLFTVEWICRLVGIKSLPMYTIQALRLHIQSQRAGGKVWPVIVLDAIFYKGSLGLRLEWVEDNVHYLRDILRTVGLVVVLMGSNFVAANLLVVSTQGASRSEGTASLWCHVVTELPKVTAATGRCLNVPQAIDRLRAKHVSLAQLLEFCQSRSNCLFLRFFAKVVMEIPSDWLLYTTAELMDAICAMVESYWRACKRVSLQGQLCLQLNAWRPTDSAWTDRATMGSPLLLSNHFAVLAGGDRELWRYGVNNSSLYVGSPICSSGKNEFVAKFVPVTEDPLLYLVFGGGVTPYHQHQARRPFVEFGRELTILSAMKRLCTRTAQMMNPQRSFVREFDVLDVLASVSIGTASRLGGLQGSTLDSFLPLLCAELLSSEFYVKVAWQHWLSLESMGASEFGLLQIPYIGMDSSLWPRKVAALENSYVANMARASSKYGVDLIVYAGAEPPVAASARSSSSRVTKAVDKRDSAIFCAECMNYCNELSWDALKKALARVPKTAKLHFVFCYTAQSEHFKQVRWSSWLAAHDLTGTNVVVVRSDITNRMWLEPLSPKNMPWLPWSQCERLVIVVAVEQLGHVTWNGGMWSVSDDATVPEREIGRKRKIGDEGSSDDETDF